MRIVRDPRALRDLRPHAGGTSLALVPTMGALHGGHARLIEAARRAADLVCVSVFVNPLQFGPSEDLSRYPRDLDRDADVAALVGADVVFAPGVDAMYPPGFATTVDPGPVATILCGRSRPGHFAGVATVVTRLFGLVRPDVAFFGAKDYQQTVVIRRVVDDLALGVTVRVEPTVRDHDGLALSSRNRFLSAAERSAAAAIPRALEAAAAAYRRGSRDADALLGSVTTTIADAGLRLDYAELRRADTLDPYDAASPAVLAVAAFAGDTRLIDNVVLEEEHR